MTARGQYGVNDRGYGAPRAGAEVRAVPVVDVDFERAPQVPLLTTRVAVWDPDAERVAGAGPSFYTERDGGWWYFQHPDGEVWFAGRRYRLIKPRGSVTVLEADPSLRVSGRTTVGASLLHTLELKQRYDNVKTGAVATLVRDLSKEGTVSSVGSNRWEIALKGAAWVRVAWYPDFNGLEITITDRELWKGDQVAPVRRRYEEILRRITPRLKSFGATTVGAATTYSGAAGVATSGPHLWSRSRAIQAVHEMHSLAPAPYYVYAEVNKIADRRAVRSLDEANALYFAFERAPGEVYAAIFAVADDASWPGPAADVYRAAPPERPTTIGITIYHSVGDRADAVKQMDIDWNALYQNLATEVGEIPYDPSQVDWSRRPPAVQKAREEELAAWKLVDTLPTEQRPAAISRARDLTERRGQLYLASFDPKKVAWWKSYAKPVFAQWGKFKSDQLGGDRTVAADYIAFAERFQTNWDVYEGWKKKLDALRAEAQKRGFTVDAPAPTALPTTVWADVASTVERGAGAVATGVGDIWNLFKYGAWAVLGIGAIVALSSVAQSLRSGRDPAEKYVELIRQRRAARGPRAGRALPAPARLALPPGAPAAEGA